MSSGAFKNLTDKDLTRIAVIALEYDGHNSLADEILAIELITPMHLKTRQLNLRRPGRSTAAA